MTIMNYQTDYPQIDFNKSELWKVFTYSPEVKHKNCSKLEKRMKIGTKVHLETEKSN